MAGEALCNARGNFDSAVVAVTEALSTARKLTQEENAFRLEIGNDNLFFGSFDSNETMEIDTNPKPTTSILTSLNDSLITEAAHAALTMEDSLRDTHKEDLQVEASNNSETTSSKPSSNGKPKKSRSSFQAPPLKEFSLVYPASEEEALLNYNQSRQRVPAIWKKYFDPDVTPLPNNVVGTVTRAVGLHYPPVHKDNLYVTKDRDAPDKTTRLWD